MPHNLKIIDTHFHIWNSAELTLPWLSLFEKELNPNYTLQDYLHAIKNTNIVKSCYAEVDVIKEQHVKEADMSIHLCEDPATQVVATTIGADMADADFPDYIAKYADISYVQSVRHNFFASDPVLTKEPIFINNAQLLGELKIMCDLVMAVEKMSYGIDLVKAAPTTTFVIDHCGLCPIKADANTKKIWQQGIANYASQPNTICKISECCFTRPEYTWQIEDVQDIIKHCVDSFGEDRCIYASNWPVCEMTANIEQWIDAIHISLQGYSETLLEKLFYKNAEKYYLSL